MMDNGRIVGARTDRGHDRRACHAAHDDLTSNEQETASCSLYPRRERRNVRSLIDEHKACIDLDEGRRRFFRAEMFGTPGDTTDYQSGGVHEDPLC